MFMSLRSTSTTEICEEGREERGGAEERAEAGVGDDVAERAGAARGVERHDREALCVARVLAQRPRRAVGREQAHRALRRQQACPICPSQCTETRTNRLHARQSLAPRDPLVVAVLARLFVFFPLPQAWLSGQLF